MPCSRGQSWNMAGRTKPPTGNRPVARWVRQQIERGGERLWRLADFPGVPATAVAQALSRLARDGQLERLSKGVYYRARNTALGKSRPNPAAIRKLATARDKPVFPAGIAAANLLGFTTQSTGRPEVATSGVPAAAQASRRRYGGPYPQTGSLEGTVRNRRRTARFLARRRQDERALARGNRQANTGTVP